jgi:RNA polymerase sigma-70 factor (ECF subfamily)
METAARPLDVTTVHDEHGDFVWATLQHLGVSEADLKDLFQEVFVVVHRHLATFEGRSALRTWLFGICTRVASTHRRRAYVRRERLVETTPDVPAHAVGPEEAAATRQTAARLAAILDEMDPAKRVVFVMAVVEELPQDQIAEVMGVPLGTVHSRLNAARKQFEQLVARQNARDARRTAR